MKIQEYKTKCIQNQIYSEIIVNHSEKDIIAKLVVRCKSERLKKNYMQSKNSYRKSSAQERFDRKICSSVLTLDEKNILPFLPL